MKSGGHLPKMERKKKNKIDNVSWTDRNDKTGQYFTERVVRMCINYTNSSIVTNESSYRSLDRLLFVIFILLHSSIIFFVSLHIDLSPEKKIDEKNFT